MVPRSEADPARIDETGRYRISLTRHQGPPARLGLRTTMNAGPARDGRTPARHVMGRALWTLLALTVLLIGGWAVQDVLTPASSAEPRRSLWTIAGRTPESHAGSSSPRRDAAPPAPPASARARTPGRDRARRRGREADRTTRAQAEVTGEDRRGGGARRGPSVERDQDRGHGGGGESGPSAPDRSGPAPRPARQRPVASGEQRGPVADHADRSPSGSPSPVPVADPATPDVGAPGPGQDDPPDAPDDRGGVAAGPSEVGSGGSGGTSTAGGSGGSGGSGSGSGG